MLMNNDSALEFDELLIFFKSNFHSNLSKYCVNFPSKRIANKENRKQMMIWNFDEKIGGEIVESVRKRKTSIQKYSSVFSKAMI